MTKLRHIGWVMVVAALPLPFLLAAQIVARADLLWFLASNLFVALAASACPRNVRSLDWTFSRQSPMK